MKIKTLLGTTILITSLTVSCGDKEDSSEEKTSDIDGTIRPVYETSSTQSHEAKNNSELACS